MPISTRVKEIETWKQTYETAGIIVTVIPDFRCLVFIPTVAIDGRDKDQTPKIRNNRNNNACSFIGLLPRLDLFDPSTYRHAAPRIAILQCWDSGNSGWSTSE